MKSSTMKSRVAVKHSLPRVECGGGRYTLIKVGLEAGADEKFSPEGLRV